MHGHGTSGPGSSCWDITTPGIELDGPLQRPSGWLQDLGWCIVAGGWPDVEPRQKVGKIVERMTSEHQK